VSADFPPTGEPPEPFPAPDVRASDADRDRVIDVLRAATADGRLTADEFSERMAAALASRTFRELAPLTADLVAPASLAPALPASISPMTCRVSCKRALRRRPRTLLAFQGAGGVRNCPQ